MRGAPRDEMGRRFTPDLLTLLLAVALLGPPVAAVDIWWTGSPQPFCDGCAWDPAMDTSWRVQDSLYVPAGQRATLQPGTIIEFDNMFGVGDYPDFRVGQPGVGGGVLDATGGAVFTTWNPPQAGEWGGVHVASGSSFQGHGVTVEYGGFSSARGWVPVPAILVEESGSLDLRNNSVVHDVFATGIEVDGTLGSGDALILDGVEIYNTGLWDTGTAGLYVHDWHGGLGAIIDNVTVRDTGSMGPFPGIYLVSSTGFSLVEVEVYNTGDEGIVAQGVGELSMSAVPPMTAPPMGYAS